MSYSILSVDSIEVSVPVCVAVKFEANTLSTMLFAYNSIEPQLHGRTKFRFAPIFA